VDVLEEAVWTFTLDMADVGPVGAELPARLVCDLLLEPLDLAAQV